jgi:hypothetical protein
MAGSNILARHVPSPAVLVLFPMRERSTHSRFRRYIDVERRGKYSRTARRANWGLAGSLYNTS